MNKCIYVRHLWLKLQLFCGKIHNLYSIGVEINKGWVTIEWRCKSCDCIISQELA